MGFPLGYTEFLSPKLFLHALSILYLIRKLTRSIFSLFGLPNFLEPTIPAGIHHSSPGFATAEAGAPDFSDECRSTSAVLLREVLPVVKFSELEGGAATDGESCAVCLTEFVGDDEIRRLANCRHVFHRGCVDRWMGYDRRTCPLCRLPVVPEDVQEAFNERLWAAFGITDDLYAAAAVY